MKKRRKIIRGVWILLVSLFGIIAILIGALMFLLTPERLTPIVNKYCSQYLNARVNFGVVKISTC
jgi:hypothetical protein